MSKRYYLFTALYFGFVYFLSRNTTFFFVEMPVYFLLAACFCLGFLLLRRPLTKVISEMTEEKYSRLYLIGFRVLLLSMLIYALPELPKVPMSVPISFFQFAPFLQELAYMPYVLNICYALFYISSPLFILESFPRVNILLLFFSYSIIKTIEFSYGKIQHDLHLPMLLLIGYALYYWFLPYNKKNYRHLVLVIAYFIIGFYYFLGFFIKLYNSSGLTWVNEYSLPIWISWKNYEQYAATGVLSSGFLLQTFLAYPWISYFLLGGSLFFEASAIVLLLVKKTRFFILLALLSMHIGIVYVLNILFLPNILIAAYLLHDWFAFLEIKLVKQIVYYDERCGFCKYIVRILSGFNHLDLVDFRPAKLILSQQPDAHENLISYVGDRRYKNYWTYTQIILRLPYFFWLYPLLVLPPVSIVGSEIYRKISKLRKCTIRYE